MPGCGTIAPLWFRIKDLWETKTLGSTTTKNKPLRVVLIASSAAIDGLALWIERLLVGLADASVPVALVCPPGGQIDPLVRGAVEVLRHPAVDLPLAGPLGAKALLSKLARFEPDLLHCLCPSKASLAIRLARRLDRPYVLSVNSLRKRWRFFPVSLRHCARIIVPARTIAANVTGLQPRLAERIQQINMGTFTAERICCFSDVSRLANIVVAHPMDRAEDFENLFAALRHMILDGYEFTTVVMGTGRAESDVRKLLAALDLMQTVTVVPPIRPTRTVIATADIFVQPRPAWAFNPSLLEAMSLGSAVAACTGGVDDLIYPGDTAVVFDHNDVLSITKTLQCLLGKREFARKIAAAALSHVSKHHSVSAMVSATLELYEQARQWYKGSKSSSGAPAGAAASRQ